MGQRWRVANRWKLLELMVLDGALIVLLGASVAHLELPGGLHGAMRRADADIHRVEGNQWPVPDVKWTMASPSSVGLSARQLDSLRASLADHKTSAFLVARDGKLVYEWYGKNAGPNRRHFLSALAKGVVGSVVVATEVSQGRISLDDPAWRYIPEWRSDSLRSQIRIRDLLFHTSGLADVDFYKGQAGRLSGWRKTYYSNPSERFSLAIHSVPLVNRPRTFERYCGVEYYALAYAVTASLRGSHEPDIKTFYRDEIMRPLGIPDRDWRLSYGQSYRQDGMTLYAFGSGANMTPRAVLRVGELLLDQGRWQGRQIIAPAAVQAILTPVSLPDDPADGRSPLKAAGGWYVNSQDAWPWLPRNAVVGEGGNDQILLIVPTMHLVMLRMGDFFEDRPTHYWHDIRTDLIQPFMGVVGDNPALASGQAHGPTAAPK